MMCAVAGFWCVVGVACVGEWVRPRHDHANAITGLQLADDNKKTNLTKLQIIEKYVSPHPGCQLRIFSSVHVVTPRFMP